MSCQEHTYTDVKPLLSRACNALETGQLICSEAFSLFEAMSAVEIGNPKMDAAAQHTDVMTLKDLINSGVAPLPANNTELLKLMDQLLLLEATWHTGNTLAQTLHASLYMLAPERFNEDRVLAAYCSIVQCTCREVQQIVFKGCVCEEEDFNINVLGLTIDPPSTSKDAGLAAVSAAIDMLEGAGRVEGGEPAEPSLPTASGSTDDVVGGLIARLSFRKNFHRALVKLQLKTKADLDLAHKLLLKALGDLERVRASSRAGFAQQLQGYCPSVNQYLLGPAPPRVVVLRTEEECWGYFAQLLTQLLLVTTVQNIREISKLKIFIDDLVASRPLPLTRSCLHLLLAPKSYEGVPTPSWAPSISMIAVAMGLPPTDHHLEELVQMLDQVHIGVTNWVQAKLLNSCRHRRRLRRGLEDWANLYQHALNADTSEVVQKYMRERGWKWNTLDPEDPQGPLATWIERETSESMVHHLLMGFELNLYQPCEYAMIFWYCDFLISIQLQDSRLLHAARPPVDHAVPSLARKGKPRPKSNATLRLQALANAAHALEVVLLELQRHLCQGMLRMMVALREMGLVPVPDVPFNSELQRFDQRFACFHLLVRPDPLHYDQYQHSVAVDPGITPSTLLTLASEAFGQVRKHGQYMWSVDHPVELSEVQLQQLKAFDKVAFQNVVAISVLLRATQGGQAVQVAFECPYHPWYPVMKIKMAKTTSS